MAIHHDSDKALTGTLVIQTRHSINDGSFENIITGSKNRKNPVDNVHWDMHRKKSTSDLFNWTGKKVIVEACIKKLKIRGSDLQCFRFLQNV